MRFLSCWSPFAPVQELYGEARYNKQAYDIDLFGLGARDANHLAPDLALLVGKCECGFGRAGEGPGAGLQEAGLHGRLRCDVFDGGVELVDHWARRTCWHNESPPRGH